MKETDRLNIFERAFSNGTGGCRRICECGKTFYNANDRGCWEEGELDELDALAKSGKAVATDYTIGDIGFEGKEYVDGCDCWHERAKKIMVWLDDHDHKIAVYLSLRKENEVEEANALPTVRRFVKLPE